VALRDKLAERSQPLLPPGTQIRQVFMCQSGPNPKWMFLTVWVLLAAKYRIVCVTDQGIYVLRQSKLQVKPKELLATLPRRQQLGPLSGALWGEFNLMGERHWVHRRFFDDVAAADQALAMAAPPPPPR
jgi:hypothetical protein